MKRLMFLLLLGTSFSISAQREFSEDNFAHQVLYYEPEQRVSDKDFSYAKMILSETKKATEMNPQNFNLADYFNVLSAFLTLQEDQELLELAFKKFVKSSGSCEYILEFEEDFLERDKYAPVRDLYEPELERCKLNPKANREFDPESYAAKNGFDPSLVKAMFMIKLQDEKYRKKIGELDPRQTELDENNQVLIDTFYTHAGTYIGRSLVGEDLENVMWSVIQHSNPEMMKKYLPIVHEAAKSNELQEVPFKMLLDRYYGITKGYQFYGSQPGVTIADEKTRMKILAEYDLE